MQWPARKLTSLLMVLLLILLTYTAGCLEDEGDDGNGDDEPKEVLANAGTN